MIIWIIYRAKYKQLSIRNTRDTRHEARTMTQETFLFIGYGIFLLQYRTGFLQILNMFNAHLHVYGKHIICGRINYHNCGLVILYYVRHFAIMAYIYESGNCKQLHEYIEYIWKLRRDEVTTHVINYTRE